MHSRTPQLLTSRQVWILTVVGTLTHVAFSGSRVTVSLAAIHLGASELVVGTLVAFFSIVPTLLAVKAGRMLDRMDPLKPMMVSVAFHVLGVLVPVIFPGLWSLLVASIMVGTASSFFYLLQQRIIGTCSAAPDRTANLGIAAIGYAVSGFIGPLASGVAIDHLGFGAAFLMLAVTPAIAMGALLAGVLTLPAFPQQATTGRGRGNALELLRQPRMLRVYALGLMFSMAWDTFVLFVPIHGSHAGLSATVIGTVMAALTAGLFTTRLALPALSRRMNQSRFLFLGHIAIGLAFLAFPLTINVSVLMACSYLVGLAVGVAQPVSMSMMFEVCPPERAGEALGLRLTLLGTSQSVLPMLFGALSTAFGLTPIFWSFAIMQFAATRLRGFHGAKAA